MGLLRLYLALCVVEAHFPGFIPGGGLGGPTSVEIFFMISGYYMAFAQPKYPNITKFYESRLFRIFPLYFFLLFLTISVYVFTGLILNEWGSLKFLSTSESISDVKPFQWLAIISNFTLFFQDFTLFFSESRGGGISLALPTYLPNSEPLYQMLIVPVSWTIALELYFYLFVPFLNRLKTSQIAILCISSLILRYSAAYALGASSSPWDYRFFPFELAFFLAGMIGYRLAPTITGRFSSKNPLLKFTDIYLIISILASLHLGSVQHLPMYPIILVLAGILILPLLFSRFKKSRWDRIIGELSYPVYLFHMLIGWLVIGILSKVGMNTSMAVTIVFIAVMITSAIVNYSILTPIERFRNRFKPQPTPINTMKENPPIN